MKIAVLAGGMSPERDVSLSSGALIATALMRRGHSVALADVYKPITTENIDSLFRSDGKFEFSVPENEPDLEKLKKSLRVLETESPEAGEKFRAAIKTYLDAF